MLTFLVLLYAHLLADYPLQGDFLAKMKGKNPILLFSHAGIWTGTVCIAAYLLGFTITNFDVAFFFTVHAVVDYLKAGPYWFYKRLDSGTSLFVDQMIHVGQIVLFMMYK